MNLLEKYGLAVRDGVYEVFMEYTKTTDLKELKESGYEVKEIPLTPSGLDKLYILDKDKKIQVACSVVVDLEKQEPEVKMHTPIEAMDILLALRASLRANKSNKH